MPIALLDTNVLVHAAFLDSALHRESAILVERGLRKRGTYCIAPQNLVEFAAVVTRRRFVTDPLPLAEVLRITDRLYRSRRLAKIYPVRGTVIRAARTGATLGIIGPRWYDLFLAITMEDAGVDTIITENVQDFRGFPFVRAEEIRNAV